MPEPDPNDVDGLVDQIRPLLAGHDPAIQGGALADLLAIFVAGHHPDIRERVMAETVAAARDLVPVNVAMLIDEGRAPPDWR